tara:strand:- start:769 stop:1137 length:369 start_codon:yes stop_codon:yes gene_type:complete
MHHVINDKFPWGDLKGKIDCFPLYKYVEEMNIPSVYVKISKLKYYNNYISEDSDRYKKANLDLPGLVVDFEDHYRLIDGKHRVTKILNNRGTRFLCHILSKDQALKFYTTKPLPAYPTDYNK